MKRNLRLFLMAGFACTSNALIAGEPARCYPTAGGLWLVSHEANQEGLYFDVPAKEVAYNVQILRLDATRHAVVYHGEPAKPAGRPGDSIKTTLASGPFGLTMPAVRAFAIHSDPNDTLSPLYSPLDAWGGAGNPMVVKGAADDPFYYVFFLALTDDNHDWKGADFRHSLCQARTRDFREFELLADVDGQIDWKPYRDDVLVSWRRPWVLRDEAGERICSRLAADPYKLPGTQGLIGSICFHDGRYYFFYADTDTDGKGYLFVRQTPSLVNVAMGRTQWSAAKRLSGPLPTQLIIRVARSRDGSRWAVLYNGYRIGPKGLRQDLFLQYTGDLSLTGPQGLAGLRWFDAAGALPTENSMWMGLNSGGGNFAQHCLVTDPFGQLVVSEKDEASREVGGMLTWADFTRGVYGGRVYWAQWTLRAATPRARTSSYKRTFPMAPDEVFQ